MSMTNHLHELWNAANNSTVPPGRLTGRTTASALRFLAAAITNPGEDITLLDWWPLPDDESRKESKMIAGRVQQIAQALDLKFIVLAVGRAGIWKLRSDHIEP